MKMNHVNMYHRFKVSGHSLLEVLIAVVVFSVGIIGVASLMLVSMRANDAALTRTQSTMLANEMYEKILANIPGAAAGNYTVAMGSSLPTTTSPECDTAICDVAQLAAWDLVEWAARANRVLPGADAAIAVDTSVDPMIITIDLKFKTLVEASSVRTETFTFRAR